VNLSVWQLKAAETCLQSLEKILSCLLKASIVVNLLLTGLGSMKINV